MTSIISQITIVLITAAYVSMSTGSDMPYTRTRRDARYDFPAMIEYVMGSHADGEEIYKGVTINLSSTGLGMYLFDMIPNGQEITIRTTLPVDSRTAAICWTRREDVNFYRSGLKFI